MNKIFLTLATLALYSFPFLANAHAFGQQYTLPLPVQFYMVSASIALVASFLFLMFYDAPQSGTPVAKTYSIPRWGIVEKLLRGIGLIIFALFLACAFWGVQNYMQNPVPEIFWSIVLLGCAYFSIFVGGWWRFVNPFETLARVVLFSKSAPSLHYPERLGFYPALLVYFGVIWIELLSGGLGAFPSVIGSLLLIYMIISLLGAAVFGIEEWFSKADFFTVFFEVIGKFAPVRFVKEAIEIRLPTERLVYEEAGHLSLLLFVLFMLSSTAFDGLSETQVWWGMFYRTNWQVEYYALEKTLLFLLSPFVFFALYALAVFLMRSLAEANESFKELLLRFAYSLIPIAIAYNFAHYFTLFVNSLQILPVLLSDPLGHRWNIFGMADKMVRVDIIGAKEVWYTQFSVILVGHIVATYVAHRIAATTFTSRKQIFLGQLPMLVLMIFYTIFGLWILTQGYQTGA